MSLPLVTVVGLLVAKQRSLLTRYSYAVECLWHDVSSVVCLTVTDVL